MGSVTVVTSGKGGAGKSTVAVGLGEALCRRSHRVLLIDGDAGLRSLDRMLGISSSLVFDISDVVAGNCEPFSAVYPCKSCLGLSLLPAPGREEDTVSPSIMKQLTGLLKGYYDHILIDCPAGVGRGFFSAISASDRAVVVSSADPVSVNAADRVRELLLDSGIGDMRLLLNRFSRADFEEIGAYEDLDEVIDACSLQLLGIVPKDQSVLSFLSAHGALSGKSPAGAAFTRIAARLDGEHCPLVIPKK